MKLNILERINLQKIINPEYFFQQTGMKFDYLGWDVSDGIRRKLIIDELEQKKANLRIEQNQFVWDTDIEKEIDIISVEQAFIVQCLKELDSRKRIDDESGPIYRRFVLNG